VGQTEPMGLYVHIPFCKAKCPYCDFYSLPADEAAMDSYVAALLRTMAHSPHTGPFDSLYFGGGTPNLLGAERLIGLAEGAFAHFDWADRPEVTLEANPGSLTPQALAALRAGGFNRISIGVQSLWDSELALLGRLHTAREALEAVRAAEQAGFGHISCDLMIGLPGQDMTHIAHSVAALSATAVDHLSVYLLKIEPGTPFYTRYAEPDPDAQADLYLGTVAELEQAGFTQYEISNFARPGGESRHNRKYWKLVPYLGLGPSAHSFVGGQRCFFPHSLEDFLAANNPFELWQTDGAGGGLEEYVMLGLRLTEGVELIKLAPLAPNGDLDSRLRPLITAGLARIEGGRLALTPRGFLVSSQVIGYLLG
jgi:oxygen-independent coproporphyrinogen-3 oxidase